MTQSMAVQIKPPTMEAMKIRAALAYCIVILVQYNSGKLKLHVHTTYVCNVDVISWLEACQDWPFCYLYTCILVGPKAIKPFEAIYISTQLINCMHTGSLIDNYVPV